MINIKCIEKMKKPVLFKRNNNFNFSKKKKIIKIFFIVKVTH